MTFTATRRVLWALNQPNKRLQPDPAAELLTTLSQAPLIGFEGPKIKRKKQEKMKGRKKGRKERKLNHARNTFLLQP